MVRLGEWPKWQPTWQNPSIKWVMLLLIIMLDSPSPHPTHTIQLVQQHCSADTCFEECCSETVNPRNVLRRDDSSHTGMLSRHGWNHPGPHDGNWPTIFDVCHTLTIYRITTDAAIGWKPIYFATQHVLLNHKSIINNY